MVAAIASCTLASSLTSSGTNVASPPDSRMRAATFSPLSTERPLTTTCAPSAATNPLLGPVATDAARWHDVYATNVFGASLVCRAALAPLTESRGRMVFISASSVGRPLPGMGAYETSKAALDELVRAWRGEHPEIGFCNVAVGNTLGTEVYQSWDPQLLGELSPVWEARG